MLRVVASILPFFGAPQAVVPDPRLRSWARFASALIFAAAVAAAAVTRHIPSTHDGILLKLEFATSAGEVLRQVPAEMRDRILRAQRDDSLLLIPVYWAFFAASGVVLLLSGGRVNRASGAMVILGITVAAACDLRENALLVEALTDPAADGNPARWARPKWLLFFISTLALSAPLLTATPHLRLHANLAALSCAVAGLWGLWTSTFRHTGIPEVFPALAVALFLLALLFLWDPEFLAKPS